MSFDAKSLTTMPWRRRLLPGMFLKVLDSAMVKLGLREAACEGKRRYPTLWNQKPDVVASFRAAWLPKPKAKKPWQTRVPKRAWVRMYGAVVTFGRRWLPAEMDASGRVTQKARWENKTRLVPNARVYRVTAHGVVRRVEPKRDKNVSARQWKRAMKAAQRELLAMARKDLQILEATSA